MGIPVFGDIGIYKKKTKERIILYQFTITIPNPHLRSTLHIDVLLANPPSLSLSVSLSRWWEGGGVW